MSEVWNLNDLYTGFGAAEFQSDLNGLGASVANMNALAANMRTFADAAALVRELEKYAAVIDRMYGFAGFTFSADTNNQEAAKYLYKLEELNAETSRMSVKLSAFLASLAKTEDLEKQAGEQGLGEYDYRIRRMVEKHSHLVTEDEEALAAKLSATGSSAWTMLHDKLISMLACDYAGPNGEIKKITINECRNLAYDKDAKVRKAAYEAELKAYPSIAEASAASLNGIKGEVNLLSKKRKYERPMDETLWESALSQKALDAMFEAMDENIRHFRDYLKAKAKYLSRQLGIPYNNLPFYDLFAPLGVTSDKKFTYEDAKAFVLDNFRRFSPKMAEISRHSFDNGWIDVHPREGKVSGAFCGHIYAIKQFRILLNFGGSISDAITLAHELGHGYHSMHIMNERILNADYPMPLAETASTFCENIVNNAALALLSDEEKIQLLENSLQDSTQVIVDIYSRYLFEKNVFETRLDHPLAVDELNEMMLNAQREAYGDGLDPEFLHPYMWVIKPHYYSAKRHFYNFPYAFGHLLANGLYKIYETEPASFNDKYDAFLRSTGKMPIKDACSALGIDIEDKKFWADAIEVIKDRIHEFKKLTV